MRFDEVITDVVNTLTAAGVRATAQLSDLNTPGAYVVFDRAEYDALASYTARIVIYAVAANTGRMQSYKQLGPLVESIRAVWPCPVVDYVDLPVPDSPDPVPAFRMPTQIIVTFD